jgi:hypothetical protein
MSSGSTSPKRESESASYLTAPSINLLPLLEKRLKRRVQLGDGKMKISTGQQDRRKCLRDEQVLVVRVVGRIRVREYGLLCETRQGIKVKIHLTLQGWYDVVVVVQLDGAAHLNTGQRGLNVGVAIV